MSKFFNDTRKAFQQPPAGRQPGAVNLDLQKAIRELKSSAEASPGKPPSFTASTLGPMLDALERHHEIGAEMASLRLQNCRSIRLPHNDERSFLSAQYNPSMQAAVESYRTLRTRLVKRQTERGIRSMVIASAEQGEGKTLTAFNMALCYANIQNWPVLLIDADLRTRGLSRMMGTPDATGLGQVLEIGCSYESAILATSTNNLYVLPAGESSCPPPELFCNQRWKEFIGWCGESFRLVIIDSPPVLDLADFELISAACESVLLVARLRKADRHSLGRLKGQLDFKKVIGVVLNASEPTQKSNYYYYGSGKGEEHSNKPR